VLLLASVLYWTFFFMSHPRLTIVLYWTFVVKLENGSASIITPVGTALAGRIALRVPPL
jgi:hypothetical protein